jgi:hypothetical protein
MAFGLILSVFGLGGLCILLFRATTYVVPAFVGFATGWFAVHTGAGLIGAMTVSTVASGSALLTFQVLFDRSRSLSVRIVITLIFALPAAFAGYHGVLALTQYGISSDIWRHVLAIVGAGIIGFTAMVRLASFAPAQG